MEPEGEATRSEMLEVEVEAVEVGTQGAPAVHDEEDVAVPVVCAVLGAATAIGLDGVDAVTSEVRLAPVDDARHLGDDPAYDVGLGAGADPRDVGQRLQG